MALGGRRPGAGRPRGKVSESTVESKRLFRKLLKGVDFKKTFTDLMTNASDDVKVKLMQLAVPYAFGKPKESMELSGTVTNITLRDAIDAGNRRIEQAQVSKAEPTQVIDAESDVTKGNSEAAGAKSLPN